MASERRLPEQPSVVEPLPRLGLYPSSNSGLLGITLSSRRTALGATLLHGIAYFGGGRPAF
jgi:hypothetical protein